MLYDIPIPVGTVTVMVPVAVEHVGCVKATVGAGGFVGCELITTSEEYGETQPEASVTEKL